MRVTQAELAAEDRRIRRVSALKSVVQRDSDFLVNGNDLYPYKKHDVLYWLARIRWALARLEAALIVRRRLR